MGSPRFIRSANDIAKVRRISSTGIVLSWLEDEILSLNGDVTLHFFFAREDRDADFLFVNESVRSQSKIYGSGKLYAGEDDPVLGTVVSSSHALRVADIN